jgi:uncharacterized membrane protein YkvA (DUF1232 family)
MKLKNLFKQGMRDPKGFFKFLWLLPKYTRLFIRLIGDSRVSIWPKIVFLASVGYFISPVDFFSEIVVPVAGYADDLMILFAASKYLLHATPPEVLEEHVRIIDSKSMEFDEK